MADTGASQALDFGTEGGLYHDLGIATVVCGPGRIEQAGGGVLFLDEVGTMSPALQAKLLRFLEEKSFRRVGGSQDIRVDVRVVAATNKDLRQAIDAREFGVASPDNFRKAAAGDDNLVSRLPVRVQGFLDHARKIDAWDYGELADHARAAGDGKAVFIVEARILHANQHFAQGEGAGIELLKGNGSFLVRLGGVERFEGSHETQGYWIRGR